MNKLFLLLTVFVYSINAMQPANPKTDALLKFALLEFVKSSNLPAFVHFMKNGQKHLIDEEIKSAANEKYENTKKTNPSNLFSHPASQILFKIEDQTVQIGKGDKIGYQSNF